MKIKIIIILFILSLMINAEELYQNPDYKVGVGDIIKLEFPYAMYLSKTYTVDNRGIIFISLFGEITVKNQTLKELSKYFSKLYSKKLVKPKVNVKLIKSYKFEQEEQNAELLALLDGIKDNFYKRDYGKSLDLTKRLSNLIVKANNRDKKVKKIKQKSLVLRNLEIEFKKRGNTNIYYIKGQIRNNTFTTYNWIKLRIDFYDKKKKKILTKYKYAITDSPINSTQIVRFNFRGLVNPEVVSAKVEIYDYLIVDK